ncbi:hypothetical protein CCYA_CCYA10G2895 [Cyanidiococcus yangmingshanensis]|nr:hypothetical protein CCYA_CCYA10G2895 [Cyanidiococcus yangmingshanensis]
MRGLHRGLVRLAGALNRVRRMPRTYYPAGAMSLAALSERETSAGGHNGSSLPRQALGSYCSRLASGLRERIDWKSTLPLLDALVDARQSMLAPSYLAQYAAAAATASGLYGASSWTSVLFEGSIVDSKSAPSGVGGKLEAAAVTLATEGSSASAGRAEGPYRAPPITARVVERAGRSVASRRGPHHIGLGWLATVASMGAKALAVILAQTLLAGALMYVWTHPQALMMTGIVLVIAFASNPTETSFLEWSRRKAPYVAAQKQGFDALRTRLAPYLLRFQDWDYFDFGVFSIVRLRDFADYVYLYVGVFNRWYLTGWYLDAPESDIRWEEVRQANGTR